MSLLYRIETLNEREKKDFKEQIQNYSSEYGKKYGRRLPRNTAIFRRISIFYVEIGEDAIKAILKLHSDVLGVRVEKFEVDDTKLVLYCNFTDPTSLKTIKMTKSTIHKIREQTASVLNNNKSVLGKIKGIFR